MTSYYLKPGAQGNADRFKVVMDSRRSPVVRRTTASLKGLLTLGMLAVFGLVAILWARSGDSPAQAATPAMASYAGPSSTASPTPSGASPAPWNPAVGAPTEPTPTCYYPDGTPIPIDQVPDYNGGSLPAYLSGCAVDRVDNGGYWTAPGPTPTQTPGPIASGLNRLASVAGTR